MNPGTSRPLMIALSALVFPACAPAVNQPTPNSAVTTAAHGTPLILGVGDGERRVRRFGGGSSKFTIKVDGQNGGSPDFVMVYEDIPPGNIIVPHRHVASDEIIFVHAGTGHVNVGGRPGEVSAGGTVFIPRDSRVTLRNTGSSPLSIVAIFSRPGMERLLRETSVLEGQPVIPLSAAELAAIRKRHEDHTVYERP